jgi:hypothetical protein
MGSLLHPVGPESTRVYWLRRGAVVLALVLVVAALAWVFRPQPEAPVTATPVTPSVTPAVTPTMTPTPSVTPSPTPTGPLACDATNSTLGLAGYQKVKQDGKQPFTLTITNTGKQSCVLDLKPSTFMLTVKSGTDLIWTTEHCDKWVPSAKVKGLKPGKAHEFTIAWPVARSGEGCKTAKSLLGAGTYVATATFAEDATARKPFVVTKAS